MKCFILGPFKVSINSNKEHSTAHAQRKLCRAIHLFETREKKWFLSITQQCLFSLVPRQTNI